MTETKWPHGMYDVDFIVDAYPNAVLRASIQRMHSNATYGHSAIVTVFEGDTALADAYLRDIEEGPDAALWLATIVATAAGCSLDNFTIRME